MQNKRTIIIVFSTIFLFHDITKVYNKPATVLINICLCKLCKNLEKACFIYQDQCKTNIWHWFWRFEVKSSHSSMKVKGRWYTGKYLILLLSVTPYSFIQGEAQELNYFNIITSRSLVEWGTWVMWPSTQRLIAFHFQSLLWPIDQRLFTYDCFVRSNESVMDARPRLVCISLFCSEWSVVVTVQKEFCCKFSIHRNNSVPTWEIILSWVSSLRTEGSIKKKKLPGIWRTVQTSESVERGRQGILQSLNRSSRKHSFALGIDNCTLRQVLHVDLRFHPYNASL